VHACDKCDKCDIECDKCNKCDIACENATNTFFSKRIQLSLINVDNGPRLANDDDDDGKTLRIKEGVWGGGLGGKAH